MMRLINKVSSYFFRLLCIIVLFLENINIESNITENYYKIIDIIQYISI
ncbi:MAG: hypothetical protein PWR10_469 [Halanaerobiales bacterium]|nr:hypothetical protein [Halanaerobiales bacterium]